MDPADNSLFFLFVLLFLFIFLFRFFLTTFLLTAFLCFQLLLGFLFCLFFVFFFLPHFRPLCFELTLFPERHRAPATMLILFPEFSTAFWFGFFVFPHGIPLEKSGQHFARQFIEKLLLFFHRLTRCGSGYIKQFNFKNQHGTRLNNRRSTAITIG